MSRLRRLSSALVLAATVAGFAVTFSTPVSASDGRPSQAAICSALDAAEAAVTRLPDGRLKTFLLKQIEAAEARAGCPAD